MKLRMWGVMASVCLVAGCGGGSSITGPSSDLISATFSGTYKLTVDLSSVCTLKPSHFEWTVVASTADAGGGVRSTAVTLPGGDSRIDLTFEYDIAGDATHAIGNFETILKNGAPIAGTSDVLALNTVINGNVSSGSGGRGQITNGTQQGEISIIPAGGDTSTPGCSAGNHRWTLIPQ